MNQQGSSSEMLLSTKANPSSQCALYVALQTMKDRCLSLQQRLTTVQEENLALRQQTQHQPPFAGGPADHQDLLAKVRELSHTKEQLNDRINMVASENRQLWSRLSQMTKATAAATTASTQPKPPNNNATLSSPNPNLIRSKTFTQNAPNPALRAKMQPEVQQSAIADLSLEEISLKVLNEMLDGKSELERLCGEMTTLPDPIVSSSSSNQRTANAYGFGYLNDDETIDVVTTTSGGGVGDDDVQLELKRCSDGMLEIRKEVLRQQSDIKVALSNLRKKRFVEVCPSCKRNKCHPPPSEAAITQANHNPNPHIIDSLSSSTIGKSLDNVPSSPSSSVPVVTKLIDFLDQKRRADSLEKMCPMCARIYNHAESFDVFQEHVESHFIDDSDLLDASLERNYEIVSHTVGDF